jgi:hypothetical protein
MYLNSQEFEECWLLTRSFAHGGVSAYIVGASRTGKTTFMANLANSILRNNPSETIFWRGLFSCQWTYFPLNKVKLLLSPLTSYAWGDLTKGCTVNIEDYVKVAYCYSPEDYLKEAEKGTVNVFHMPKDLLADFLQCLNQRYSTDWVSVFFDEIQEVAPENAQGKEWHFVRRLGEQVGQLAKRWVSFYCASQSYTQVSYFIKTHMQYWVFMPKALKPSSRNFRVYQRHIDSLSLGWCCIEGKEGFADVPFSMIKPYAILTVKEEPLKVGEHEYEEEAALNLATA